MTTPSFSTHRKSLSDARSAAGRMTLITLTGVWIAAFTLSANAVWDALVPGAGRSTASVIRATDDLVVGWGQIAAVGFTVLLGTLLALMRLWLPERDRAALGLLVGAWLVTFDVATLSSRHPFLSAGLLTPMLSALLSASGLCMVITAAVRRWRLESEGRTSSER